MGRLLQHIYDLWSTKRGALSPARRRFLLSLVVAILGVALSVAFFSLMRMRELDVARQQFLHSGEWRAEVLQHEMIEQLHAVTTLEAFFAGSSLVDRKEFRTFAESIHAGRKGVLAVGWATHIYDAQRRSHERIIRDEGLSKYRITERTRSGKFAPAATRAEYCPIVYIEPNETCKSLLGFDIQSIPECRAAIRRAASTKRPAAGICTPLIDGAADHVILFVVATADNVSAHGGKRPADQSGRDGFVFGLFEIDVTAKSALAPMAAPGIYVSLTAPTSGQGGDMAIYPLPPTPDEQTEAAAPKNLRFQTQINIVDRHWNFDCVALKAFWKRRSTWEPTTVLLAGLLVTGFLVGYLHLLTGRTARVEQLVAGKTRELQASEQRFRRLVDNAADAFFLHTEGGELLDVNKRACESLGYTREELLSMTLADIDVDYVPKNLRRHSEHRSDEYPINFEGVHRRKDGTTFPVEIRLTFLALNGQRLMLGLARDISERKQMQKTLQEGRLKLSAILDQTFQFIGLMTPDGVLIEANRSALVFSGVSLEEILNKPFWETAWWSHSAALQQELREAVQMAAKGDFVRMEATHLAANGELHWIDFSLKPIKDETGNVVFLIPEGRDITARKHMEEALNKEQQLLRSLLDLQEQDRKLVAYEIHDGLAQQLAGALYKFQSIDVSKEADFDAARTMFDDALRVLREAMAETRRLISGLRPPVLDESGVIDAIDYMITELQARGGPKIDFTHPENFPRLAQPLESAIFRIVQECLTNACRHSQSDKVRVELRQADSHVHVEVRDWGVGFDPANVQYGHYGLQGIRERARLLGGAASIETASGNGACITVSLPMLPPREYGTVKREIPPRMDAE